MKKIDEIDKNLAVKPIAERDGLRFFDVCSELFGLYGVTHDTEFQRLPKEVAKTVSDGVYSLHGHTAGGCVHFRTNSKRVAIRCEMAAVTNFSHMPATGTHGFDLYADGEYWGTFVPPTDMTDGYESVINFPDMSMRGLTINFPLYNGVTNLYVGLDNGSECKSFNPYRSDKPIVYYVSSITQGGCASRPGMCYQAIISRRLGIPNINLGFSGSALGETKMAEYIAGIEMCAFVFDYDYNAPNAEHLRNTHEKFFKIVREANPNLPIIMLSQHSDRISEAEERRRIIFDTYNNAVKNGDNNVYYIDGFTLFPNRDCTVDGCHPTDLGFWFMAEKIGDVLAKIL